MRHSPRLLALAMVTAVSVACSDDSAGLDDPPCLAETTAVNANVVVGAAVVFDWSPRCAVAMLLVEAVGGSDRWVIGTPEHAWETSDLANQIVPPITYGQLPNRITGSYGPEPLVVGQAYQLVLWRALPNGSAALLAVETFTR